MLSLPYRSYQSTPPRYHSTCPLLSLCTAGPVLPLKDPTSDMAVIARTGSKLVKDVREKKDASKSRARFWEMAGSKMGKITGAYRLIVCSVSFYLVRALCMCVHVCMLGLCVGIVLCCVWCYVCQVAALGPACSLAA